MKVLIVGANGFLGQELCKQALALNWQVVALYHRQKKHIPQACQIIKINNNFKNIKQKKFNLIFFAAGSFTQGHDELIDSQIKLLLAIKKKFLKTKIILASSGEIKSYQKSLYAQSKLAAEFIASSFAEFVILRLSYLYGHRMSRQTFLSKIIQDALFKKEVTLHDLGLRKHDYLSVEDAAACFIKAVKAQNGIYTVATGKSYSNLEIAKKIQKITSCKIKLENTSKSTSWHFNVKRTQKLLAWSASHNLLADLKHLIKHHQK